jgi:hypothetical protein
VGHGVAWHGQAGFGMVWFFSIGGFSMRSVTAIGPATSNGALTTIEQGLPYRVQVTLCGEADLLFHRWNCEAIAAKAKASKGSAAKKTDDLESYVHRNDAGELCLPGEYLRQSIIGAAKYRQDPRSPRKSAQDLTKAAVVALTPLASLGIREWDYDHRCRAQVQRAGITRVRPAIKAGWKATFVLLVHLPEYVSTTMLHGLITDAGRFVGVGDYRPTYGRFQIVGFEILTD